MRSDVKRSGGPLALACNLRREKSISEPFPFLKSDYINLFFSVVCRCDLLDILEFVDGGASRPDVLFHRGRCVPCYPVVDYATISKYSFKLSKVSQFSSLSAKFCIADT